MDKACLKVMKEAELVTPIGIIPQKWSIYGAFIVLYVAGNAYLGEGWRAAQVHGMGQSLVDGVRPVLVKC